MGHSIAPVPNARRLATSAVRWLLTALIVACAGGVFDAAAWALSCGDHVPAGTRARLDADLLCTDGNPALTLEAGARLDMNGHTVRCDGEVVLGIVLTGGGARLHDGTVANCSTAVYLFRGEGNVVRRVRTVREGEADDSGSTGFLVGESSRNTLTQNEASGFEWGFEILGVGNRVIRNDAYGNQLNFLVRRERNRLQRNTSTGALDSGIIAVGNDHRLIRNVSNDNIIAGIAVEGSRNRVVGNVTLRNVIWGIINVRFGFDEAGIDNMFTRNRALMNGDADLVDWFDCTTNTWKRNVFETSESPESVPDPDCIN